MLLMLLFIYLHGAGLFLFTKGFLLTRLVLPTKSTCEISPLHKYDGYTPKHALGSAENGCWHPKTFDKAVIVVIDALRFDFTVPIEPTDNSTSVRQFQNAFTTPYRIASRNPRNAVLLPFIADPPTTTLQRLKGLTTGSLPTFIDAGSNFAGQVIDEDNLISQLKALSKRTAFMGDDTWLALFPGLFEPDMEHPYESLNVWDLHTVDNGVTEHLFPLLHPDNSSKWDVAIGHYLGVDHAGHRYGPDHFAMKEKLLQMDGIVQRLVESIDDNTLLVVMGDHGMDSKGDHGGESPGELEAALWMYSKRPSFGEFPKGLEPNGGGDGGKDGVRSVAQIDLVPTLALLLGLPVPFNNLGAPIAEAFYGEGGVEGWRNLAEASLLTAAQIKRYQKEYAGKNGEDVEGMAGIGARWNAALEDLGNAQTLGKRAAASDWGRVHINSAAYQLEALRAYRNVWAKFDLPSMAAGVTVLAASVIVLAIYSRGFTGDHTELTDTLLTRMAIGLSMGAVFSVIDTLASRVGIQGIRGLGDILGLSGLRVILFSTSMGIILGFLSATIYAWRRLASLLPTSGWGVLSVVFTVCHSMAFGSNSFTIWEDKILTFFLSTFAIGGLAASQRRKDIKQRTLGTTHSIIFFILVRIASLSRLCREEQMPYCKSTFYASATSSVSAPWSLALLFAMAVALPSVIKSFYRGTKSYEGPAPVYIGWAFRAGLFLGALYWLLDSADNGGWLNVEESVLKSSKTLVAQVVLAMGLLGGNLAYTYSSLCLGLQVVDESKNVDREESSPAPAKSVLLLGYSNLHGAHYFLLVTAWALALILLQKPMGGASMGILIWQILSLLEIIDCNGLSESAIGPIVLGILGNSHFFSTGHQATLSAIQWESAFIPFSTVRYPWSPLLVVANSVGPQILTAIAVPLITLWKSPPTGPGQLGKTGKSVATHLLYHSTITLSAVACAGHLRRHLMLYRIFSPRFMLGGIVLLVVDVVAVLVGMGGFRSSSLTVGEVFGY